MGTGLKELGRFSRTVIITMLLLCGIWTCANPPVMKPSMPTLLAGAVRFTVHVPGAKEVCLVGSFNGWTKGAAPMKVVDDASLWSIDMPLAAGEHTFMYVIDGVRWITPPHAEDFVTDGFGHTNGIVIVR